MPYWNSDEFTPLPIPASGVFDSPTVNVCINSGWATFVDGALQPLLDPHMWNGTESEVDAAIQSVQELLIKLAQIKDCSMCSGVEFQIVGGVLQERCDGGEWIDVGNVVGPQGPQGDTGAQGPAGPKIIGTIIPYATAAVPIGCLACDGTQYNRVDYPALYAALHAAFKTDADHFVVPDLRDRTIIGIGSSPGAGFSARSMKDTVGAETHALTIAEMPAHTHDVSTNAAGTGGTNGVSGTTNTSNTQTATAKGLTRGSGSAHNNMQPSLALGYCIVAVA
jgi:microcystin-dependent protein